MGTSVFLVGVAIALVALNGFFVAAEFGLVKLRATRVRAIAETRGWRGRILAKVHHDLDAYLSACQLGITLASLGLGWVGEPAFADLLAPLLAALGIDDPEVIHAIAFFVAFFVISYLHIVVGELVPKSMAIRMAERIGLWTAPPLYAFYWVMYPAIWVLNHSANWLLRQANLDVHGSHDSHYSVEELKLILRSSRADAKFTRDEWRVLAQALDFRELNVADLMHPFSEAVTLSSAETIESSLRRIAEHRFSRYPYLDAQGRVVGAVHMKDVFVALRKDAPLSSLASLVRPIALLAPAVPATELFRRFQQGTPHMAVVVSPDGRPVGFVTLDHLLVALVGEIGDEFRPHHKEWTRRDDGALLGKASLPIVTLERALGIDIEDEGADSVGGLVLQRLGDLPHEGQRIEFGQFAIVIKKMAGPRIVLVTVIPQPGLTDRQGPLG